MFTIQQAISQGREHLSTVADNPQNEALLLLEHISEQRKEYLIAHSDELLNDTIEQQYLNALQRRQSGEPLAYITQTKEFWSLELNIEPGILIPRPDTELLIETTLAITKQKQSLNILDLGTGSGCIALALAKELPQSNIVACDNSQTCINVAEKNADKLKLNNVSFILSDWFNEISKTNFDIIVSNPPYISPQDPNIEHEVKTFEPASALFADNNGYADLYTIIQQAKIYLNPGGTLIVEHGFQQAKEIRSHLKKHHFQKIKSHKDLQQHERVTQGHV